MLRWSVIALSLGVVILLAGCGQEGSYRGNPSATSDPGGALEPAAEFNTESYAHVEDNPFLVAAREPLSTFSIDVDTASYANVRRLLQQGQRPPPGAVRIEELINYFRYDYAPPTDNVPFAVNVEVAGCPWNAEHRLARIALKGREIDVQERPPSNLVFLVDVSGSMDTPNKLPLVKQGLKLLTDELDERDHISIVVYAGSSGLVLPPTSADQKTRIHAALDRLQAGGSTAGSQGIKLAYHTAQNYFLPGGNNRVILCTDGDFNVGVTNHSELVRLITEKAKTGVFLSVLGFGYGNYKDDTMELLADKGNGNYAYIDSEREARKVLIEELTGTLLTIAKDVKIQVDFNPAQVAGYRLIGYENRLLRAQDFQDDTKDAGEIGAGHTVTALYEIVPAGKSVPVANVEPSKYQQPAEPSDSASDELLTVRLRYKEPESDTSLPLEVAVKDNGQAFAAASDDFRFAAAVAAFGMLLRDSPHKAKASFAQVQEIAAASLSHDPSGYRAEFLELVRLAEALK